MAASSNKGPQQDLLQYIRHVVQFIAFVFLNGKILGFMSSNVIVPYLYPAQAPYATAAGAFEALEFTIARGAFPLLVLGVILLTGITVGKVFCGWACPVGLLQDLLSYLPVKKSPPSAQLISYVKDIKWAFLVGSLTISILAGWRKSADTPDPVGVFSDSAFAVLSPSGTLFAYIPWMILWKSNVLISAGIFGWLKFVLLVAAVVPSVYYPRFFCRYVCPMGAALEPLSEYKLLRIGRAPGASVASMQKVLDEVCPTGVKFGAEAATSITDGACIHCGKCVSAAPQLFTQEVM